MLDKSCLQPWKLHRKFTITCFTQQIHTKTWNRKQFFSHNFGKRIHNYTSVDKGGGYVKFTFVFSIHLSFPYFVSLVSKVEDKINLCFRVPHPFKKKYIVEKVVIPKEKIWNTRKLIDLCKTSKWYLPVEFKLKFQYNNGV